MNYQKTVLGHKSPHLKTSVPSVARLMENLKRFLRQGATEAAAGQAEADKQLAEPLQFGREGDHQLLGDEDHFAEPMDVDTDHDLSSESSDEAEEETTFEDFVFTRIGENVAVFYDNDFHVGSVAEIFRPDQARVNFLRKCTVANNTYVWPHKPEDDSISAMFVFSSGFEVTTQNGRVWSVPEHDKLRKMYLLYKQRYA
ncbi:uncharacterized protein LOC143280571 [Babylonia areolata]